MTSTVVELLVAVVAWTVLSKGPVPVLSKSAEENLTDSKVSTTTPATTATTPAATTTTDVSVSCWAQINDATKTCRLLIAVNMTVEECCKSNGDSISWSTVEEVSPGDLFKYQTIYGGVPDCQLCERTCEQTSCPSGRKCIMKSGRPRCVCKPNCTKNNTLHKGPVCATNGKQFRSMCAFLKMKCRQQDEYFELDVAYNGPCQDSCDNVRCLGDKCCDEDQHGRPHCVSYSTLSCPAPFNEEFVCGEDGVSYETLCQLRRTSCSSGRIIPVAYQGKCENLTSCNDTNCVSRKECMWDQVANTSRCILCNYMCSGWVENVLVCATDGQTYDNWCDMQDHICQTGTYVEKVHFGRCDNDWPTDDKNESGSGHWMYDQIDFTPSSWQVLQDLRSGFHRGQGKEEDDSIAQYSTVNGTAVYTAEDTATTVPTPVLDTPEQTQTSDDNSTD